MKNIIVIFFIIFIYTFSAYAQEKDFKYKIGEISENSLYSYLSPNTAIVEIITKLDGLKFSSNTGGLLSEISTFGKKRLITIKPEKQKLIIKKQGYKDIKILIPKLSIGEKISIELE